MLYFLILLLVFVFSILIIDWIPQFNTWQSRIKIGRFEDKNFWNQKVVEVSKKWLNKTPTIKLTDNNRLIIIDIIKGNYKRNSIQSWQKASLLLGLNQFAIKNNDGEVKKIIQNYILSEIDSNGNWKQNPTEIDAIILAYAILKVDGLDVQKYKPALDFSYNLIQNLKGTDGTIAYRNHISDFRFVDTIGFISPFLIRYGTLFSNQDAIYLGIKQITEFNKFAMLNEEFIPCHTYNIKSNLPVGLFGWGRGLGWYAIGLIDAWNELPETHSQKKEMTQLVTKFAQMAMKFQNENGSWNWLILNRQSQADSSTTATLAWFLANAASISEISDKANSSKEKALNYLQKVTRRSGAIDFSQGDTKGIGVHSQEFDILPFTQGFCLRTLNL
ncbi:glycoside hydrolase family 88 protein [Flavobacterium sp.]|uniref:glycoside hydrolase family 88 protein n=1 Tax=Flavobacterium sp. TaxID=239 RepID=UPI0026251EBF|nr:glycoside hydrolase family 88 protein [Flavobacterium sp.]